MTIEKVDPSEHGLGEPSIGASPPTERAREWMATMTGYSAPLSGISLSHGGLPVRVGEIEVFDRLAREAAEDAYLAPGATRSIGGGRRAIEEDPESWRTCFERDRDRVLHKATSFRRLAGKTQVFIFPEDHQRTRLTHALEVAQVATAIARATRLNYALAETIALGHDCGHGPFGHASEDAFDPFVPGGFRHAPWGADVTLADLNLCEETLDGIRNHSWSRPAPATPEGVVVRLADRIAYVCHDFEDAVRAGLAEPADLPPEIRERCGAKRSAQLRFFIRDVVETVVERGVVAMSEEAAFLLGAFRQWNYDNIYLRPASVAQAVQVGELLTALVELFVQQPLLLETGDNATGLEDPIRRSVAYVAGMTDRFACNEARRLLGWTDDRLPRGVDRT